MIKKKCVNHPNRTVKDGSRTKCSGCYENNRRASSPLAVQKQRLIHVRVKYGMSEQDFNDLFSLSNGLCDICGKPETRLARSGRLMVLCVDHDHETGLVRGLLCHKCNAGIGQLNDSPELLRKAIAYLEKSRE